MTMLWTQDDLLLATAGAPLATGGGAVGGVMTGAGFAASGVSIDSRSLIPGDLFVALRGEHGDGHDHVADALARGAAGALVHREVAGLAPDARLLLVADTLEGLRALGRYARARFTGRLVAVTGSVGKTTTKEMLRRILAAAGPTHAAEASYNNHWGVPLTLARLDPAASFAVIEIGMNHAGEIAPLARLARPHVGVITAIAAAHLGHLGSLTAIAAEKASLLGGLEPGGVAVLPNETPFLDLLEQAAGTAQVVRFGIGPGCGARLVATENGPDSVRLNAQLGDHQLVCALAAPGTHMAMNALAALAAASALSVDPDAAAAALAGFAPLSGRGARRSLALRGGQVLLLDESYNASAASVRAALAVLALQPGTRRLAVLGEMLELGEAGWDEHAGLAADVAGAADLAFTCGVQMRALFEALPPARRGAHAADSTALAPLVAAAATAGDAILVKGSLGSRMRQVIAALDDLAAAPAGDGR